MRLIGRMVAGLLLWSAAAGVARAQDAATLKTFETLNASTMAIYRDAKQRFLGATGPVVIAGGSVQIAHKGAITRCCEVPDSYDVLKTVGHVPRSIWAAMRPAIEGLDPEQTWRQHLTGLRPQAEAALAALPQAGLPPDVTSRDAAMLKDGLALLDRYLAEGVPTLAELQTAIQKFSPTILADASDAAGAQLDAIDAVLRPWWHGLSDAERAATYVVVLGPKAPRVGNAIHNYFINLVGSAGAGRRVIYAEGMFTPEAGEGVLAALVTERRLSIDFFADEQRMDRDLLSDGGEARLLQMFGRLGGPPPAGAAPAAAKRLAASP